ncbi:hypothetical protein PBI_WINKY_137 [Mycobacterium phage Winky]|nr:hypothetical protein PBI_WINKY_137 [Mycobacterium phage Winky]AGM12734.1 hypothetical protein PBI_BREEZONA_137 [Mycobacterium phage Breezona]AOT22990.1 hypothetical protein SEA_ZAKAI_139 [Mycobacterium phage Zakai]ASM62731.1 hypothetical protein SEA_MILEY16_137 [Mycobacterium phage Miley16]QDH92640.1 hypothetical protein SEA_WIGGLEWIGGLE_138 [Mycobacterium phage Wigglewiggle]QGZ16646.1 hypothetical protein PBI_GABRIELA_137 [Mycobacterium phage Gabriela]QGZ17096.1 hypothetical protein PBI_I
MQIASNACSTATLANRTLVRGGCSVAHRASLADLGQPKPNPSDPWVLLGSHPHPPARPGQTPSGGRRGGIGIIAKLENCEIEKIGKSAKP